MMILDVEYNLLRIFFKEPRNAAYGPDFLSTTATEKLYKNRVGVVDACYTTNPKTMKYCPHFRVWVVDENY